jgi:hypothetical protein
MTFWDYRNNLICHPFGVCEDLEKLSIKMPSLRDFKGFIDSSIKSAKICKICVICVLIVLDFPAKPGQRPPEFIPTHVGTGMTNNLISKNNYPARGEVKYS